jgi:MFS family permease
MGIIMANVETSNGMNPKENKPVHRKIKIILVLVTVSLFWISLYAYIPTLPIYVQSKIENLSTVGFVLATFGIWQIVIRLPLGIASDRVGRRKPFIMVGLVLSGVGAWIMGMSKSASGLAVGRSLSGIAASTWVTMLVFFSSLFPPEDAVQATSILTLVNSIGRMLGTGITGTLNNLGGYSLSFMVAAGAALIAVLVMFFVRERRIPRTTVSSRGLLTLVTRRDVLVPSLLNMVRQYANWGVTFSFVPILASQFGATDNHLSALTSMNIAINIAGNLFATFTVNKLGSRKLIYGSILLMGGAIGLAALATNLTIIFIAQFCNGLAGGIGYPVLTGSSIEYVSEGERATAMGLHQAVYAIGMTAGPWLSGVLAETMGIQPMFAWTAVAYLVLSIIGARKLR